MSDGVRVYVHRFELSEPMQKLVEAAERERERFRKAVGRDLADAYLAAERDVLLFGAIRPETWVFLKAALEDEVDAT